MPRFIEIKKAFEKYKKRFAYNRLAVDHYGLDEMEIEEMFTNFSDLISEYKDYFILSKNIEGEGEES